MAILLSDFVWEGVSTEPWPAVEDGARDGQIIKHLDTGESYIRRGGVWTFINMGLSFIKATKSGRIVTDANGNFAVGFITPFIDDQYTVALSMEDPGTEDGVTAIHSALTPSGFTIKSRKIITTPRIDVLSNQDSDIAGYKRMPFLPLFVAGPQATIVVAASTTPVLLKAFATDSGFPGAVKIPSGAFNVQYRTAKDSGIKAYFSFFELYKRALDGTETLLTTSHNSSQREQNEEAQVDVTALLATDIILLPTDRLVLKIYAQMVSHSASVSLLFDGNICARLEFPSNIYPVPGAKVGWVATRNYNP